MKTRHYFLLLAFLFSAHLTGCRAGKPDERHNAELQAPSVGMSPTPMSATSLPDTVVGRSRPALIPRLTDAIGLSTPEGRARRQARKDAAATVPRSIGKGAVWAPNAQQVASAYKSDAPTSAAAPNAVVSNAAENSQQQNVKGNNNGLTADKHDTTQQAKDWKAELATPVGKTIAIALFVLTLACIGGVLYYVIPLLPKRRKDPVA